MFAIGLVIVTVCHILRCVLLPLESRALLRASQTAAWQIALMIACDLAYLGRIAGAALMFISVTQLARRFMP